MMLQDNKILIIGLAFSGFQLFSGQLAAQVSATKYQAFTATFKVQYWTESGRTILESRTFARRSDGSYAFISDKEDPLGKDHGPRGWFGYVFDASAQSYMYIESFTKTAVVKPVIGDKEFAAQTSAYGSCQKLEDGSWKVLGRSKLFGLDVVKVEVEDDERSTMTDWIAPDLQCFALRHTEILDMQIRVKEDVASLELGEPDRTLFQAPEGFDKVSPLEQERRYQAAFPGKELWGRFANRLEDEYQMAYHLRKTNGNNLRENNPHLLMPAG